MPGFRTGDVLSECTTGIAGSLAHVTVTRSRRESVVVLRLRLNPVVVFDLLR